MNGGAIQEKDKAFFSGAPKTEVKLQISRQQKLRVNNSLVPLSSQSDTCRFTIPEMDFELMMGTLGGKFTTLEGILTDIKNQLLRPFALMRGGDSATKESGGKLRTFIDKLDEVNKVVRSSG